MQQGHIDCTWQKHKFFTSSENANIEPIWDVQENIKRNIQTKDQQFEAQKENKRQKVFQIPLQNGAEYQRE